MSVKGFDISSNNGSNLDFHKAYKAGYRFVYIKVTEGTNYVNPYAAKHAREAKAAGLLVGAYCFVSPRSGRTGVQEADYFIKHARNAGLLAKGCLRPVADIEITALPKGKPSRVYHYAFVTRVAMHLKRGSFNSFDGKPFIYTASWFWDGILGARNAHGCPLWLAAYTSSWHKYVPRAFKGASIHQYTDHENVAGVGKADADRYLGKNVKALAHNHTLKHAI